MLEETNDNLQEADGKLVNETIESTPTENVLIEEAVVAEEVINEVNTTEENVADALVIVENENQKQLQPLMILMQRKARTRRLESAMRFQC
jgi:enhancing lycopene biosynthesis protein 2